MWPYLVEVTTPQGEPFQIPMYGTMMTLAFTLAFVHVHVRARRIGIHPDRLIPIYLAAAAGGLVGSRILYIIAVEGVLALFDPTKLFAAGGFAFYGGFLGGAAGVFTLAWLQRMNGWKLADLLAPALLLGMGVGRVGCFFAGCCHGAIAPKATKYTTLWDGGDTVGEILWQSSFPFITNEIHQVHAVTREALKHEPLFPTQAWAAFVLIGLCLALTAVWYRRRFDGQVVALMLIIEPLSRIVIESFRADHRGYSISWPVSPEFAANFPLPGLTRAGDSLNQAMIGLTTSQTLGIGMVILGMVIFAMRWNSGVAPEVPIKSEDDDEDDDG